jgi:hypothetical protein
MKRGDIVPITVLHVYLKRLIVKHNEDIFPVFLADVMLNSFKDLLHARRIIPRQCTAYCIKVGKHPIVLLYNSYDFGIESINDKLIKINKKNEFKYKNILTHYDKASIFSISSP